MGNGFVMESINDVLRVYDTSGNALVGTTDLNTFYGYIAAINRATNARGPSVTDPSCFFDPDTQRWFQSTSVSGSVILRGIFGLANNNLTYPAVGVTASGRGLIAFTVLGNDNFPSAGYSSLDAHAGAGDVHLIASGLGPDDGFTAYKAFLNPGQRFRTRWGDYGYTALDGNSIWIASEYIGQTCDLTTYVNTGFACNGTRTSLGNWYTRISKLTP